MPETKTAARLIAEALAANGIDRVFCVPGESYLALLDALYDTDIAVTVFRHEGGAAMAAEAYGKLTGRPGIALVTRGPGAVNAGAGIHVARHDSTPLIVMVGQVPGGHRGRDAFQEIDVGAVFAPLAKAVAEIERADHAPEIISRAFHQATSGRPGPVVIALPEDVLRETTGVANPAKWVQVHTHPGLTLMAQLQKMLWAAERPLAIVGGSRWNEAAVAGMRRFAERFELPVAASFRRQHLFDNDHPNYAGALGIGPNPDLARRVREADVLLVVGGRMGEVPSAGFSLIDIPEPKQALVHVHPGAEELGRLYRPTLAINASPAAFVSALESLQPPHRAVPWSAETKAARASYEAWSRPVPNPGPVQLAEIVAWLRGRLPDDAIVASGAGNYALWVQRFFRFRSYHTQLAPTSGTMGYGLPAAIAAKLVHPERVVVCFTGDGDFQMTSNEFQTAVEHNAAVVVVVVNNGVHGSIRLHQERAYPGRQVGTAITSPDYAGLARAHGGHGETVARTEDFAPAFERALASARPAIIELAFDPEAAIPGATLADLRGKDRGKRAPVPLSFRPVTEASRSAFEAFFSAPGAPHFCWCMVWRRTAAEAKHHTGTDRKRQMMQRIAAGTPVGLIAYDGDTPAGWVSVAPRDTYRNLGGPPAGEGEVIWSIVCFFVPRRRRGAGTVRDLIAGAVAHARGEGATIVEAYPVDRDAPSYRYMGFVDVFAEAGFTDEGMAGVRRHVMRLKV